MEQKEGQLKAELLAEVVGQTKGRLSGARAQEAENFLRQFYANVAADDILGEAPLNLYGAGLAIWTLGQKRKVGTAKVRAYNPRPEEQGWKSSHSIIEIINDDMPFLVDSVMAQLAKLGHEVYQVIHPVLCVVRDETGRIEKLCAPDDAVEGSLRESFMHIQINELPPELLEKVRIRLGEILDDIRICVQDWKAMRGQMSAIIEDLEREPPKLPPEEISEGIEFLKWINDNHFTYLGFREYRFEGKDDKAVAKIAPDTGLGLLRDQSFRVFEGLRDLGKLPPDVQDFVKRPELLRCTKANQQSTVHRTVHLDTIAVKQFDKKGQVIGERLFLGLFTSQAYSRPPSRVPLLRRKIAKVFEKSGFDAASHDGKSLFHILESYPRDELFQIEVDELLYIARGVLHLQERKRISVFPRRDPFERFVSFLVYVPRDRFDTRLRMKILDILAQALAGSVAAFSIQLSEEALARLHIIIKTAQGKVPDIDVDDLERRIAEASRSWDDLLRQVLIEDRGEEQGLRAFARFGNAFPPAYQDHYDSQTAVSDTRRIEEALHGDGLAMNLYRPIEAQEHEVRFKTYHRGKSVPLSDVLPMLENMGLRVMGEAPYEISFEDGDESVWIHDFALESADGSAVSLSGVKEAFHEAFSLIWHGHVENDGFNKLVLRAGLRAREVLVLRAYCKFLRQAGIPFSQEYMEETLARNPGITQSLVKLFMIRFADRAGDDGERKAREKAAKLETASINEALESVANLDEDRIIRRFLNGILCTLRSNFAQRTEKGEPKEYLSFKFASRDLEDLPKPRPFREIFVYSPRIEGVHLRFGKVARGGLRWSDRREDFRTEILGLVKAQQVKNSVIVPVGSKGGFVVKNPPPADAGREAFLEEGIACYRIFISGLLDITDNLKGADLIPPPSVMRWDEDDPYLVVAADKGTATFSDIANGVSQDYGFWLDDAFASGGSAGYDHKKMGITARGAWESVKRHFRETGKDIQKEDFTVIGVGDMSGDVFGNGMLLSEHIKLVAAFNHMHIFIDPNPDPAKSFAERKRLFDLPRSAWTDYDQKLISKGGGIFDRKAKSIKLTPEIKALLRSDAEQLTPNALLSALLQAEVELLWFGGIGTYVKHSEESDAEAGDRANDAIRVNGKALRCKVVGEGANLGMTQRARIEFALAGGRVNTDFIDNSAGVDCSDHEVNIKILLGDIETAGDMTRKQRDILLAKMTDEVAELVLRDNYLQTQSITVTESLGAHLMDRLARFMRTLEKQGLLDRPIEFLPDDETIAERMAKGIGMTRPELSVLLSYAKINLYDALIASRLPDDPFMESELIGYFPKPLQQKFAKQIRNHRLRREIVATIVTNDLVNRVGAAFVHEAGEKTGMDPEDVARAYTATHAIFDMEALYGAIEALDNKVSAACQSSMLVECGRTIERATVWLLRNAKNPIAIAEEVETYRAPVAELAANLEDLLPKGHLPALVARCKEYESHGVPGDLAKLIAGLPSLAPALDIVRIAGQQEQPVLDVGRAYFIVGHRFGLDWLRHSAGRLPSDTAWEKLAVTAIVDDLYGHQSDLTRNILAGIDKIDHAERRIEDWATREQQAVARTERVISEIQSQGTADLAMLAVANRQLRALVGN